MQVMRKTKVKMYVALENDNRQIRVAYEEVCLPSRAEINVRLYDCT